jgi:hypothetical protein
MPPKKKGGKAKKEAAPVLTGPEAELEAERQLLIAEAKALKRRKEMEEVEYNEYQQEKVGSGIHAPSRVFLMKIDVNTGFCLCGWCMVSGFAGKIP